MIGDDVVQRNIPAGSLYFRGFLEVMCKTDEPGAMPSRSVFQESKASIVKSGTHPDPVAVFIERYQRREDDIDTVRIEEFFRWADWLGNTESITQNRSCCAILRECHVVSAHDRQKHFPPARPGFFNQKLAVDFATDRKIRCYATTARHERQAPESGRDLYRSGGNLLGTEPVAHPRGSRCGSGTKHRRVASRSPA